MRKKIDWKHITAVFSALLLSIAALAFSEPALNTGASEALLDTGTAESAELQLVQPGLAGESAYDAFLADDPLSGVPEYAGLPFVRLNDNIPFFAVSELSTEAFASYRELDALGRCGAAYANVCPELMPEKERDEIGMVRPSGWHTVRYDDLIEDHYLYNRCHLIGYQLTGENANPCNLITGTRYLNVEGMEPFENRVAAYVKRTGNHVLYRVTPIFAGEDLVASGVVMEAWSVEDNGAGVCFNAFVYNVQPGIEIDYSSGESRRVESYEPQEPPEIIGFIGNSKSLKYHLPGCPNLPQKRNWVIFETEEEAIGSGYTPCGNCIGQEKSP